MCDTKAYRKNAFVRRLLCDNAVGSIDPTCHPATLQADEVDIMTSERRKRATRRRRRSDMHSNTRPSIVSCLMVAMTTLPTLLYADEERPPPGRRLGDHGTTEASSVSMGEEEEGSDLVRKLIESSGTSFWSRNSRTKEGDDNNASHHHHQQRRLEPLPAFILSHDNNRRWLQEGTSVGIDSFGMTGDTVSDEEYLYGIGRAPQDDDEDQRSKHKGSKKGGKGNGSKSSKKHQKEPPHRPSGNPRPSGNNPRPPTRPSPVVRPTQPRPPSPPTAPTVVPSPSLSPPTQRPPPPTAPTVSPPSLSPPTVPSPLPLPPSSASTFCRVPITISFLQFSAIPPALVVYPDDPNAQDLGTRYVYNNDLRDPETLDELSESRCTGICTRTQSRFVIGGDDEEEEQEVLQLGGGQCSFTYSLFDGERGFTFEATGMVVDSLGGTLAITGGTKDAIGAFGEIELLPINVQADGSFVPAPGDFFLEPLFYLADATLFVPCGGVG